MNNRLLIKYFLLFTLCLATASVFAACGTTPSDNGGDNKPIIQYTVKFYSHDGLELLSEIRVDAGKDIVYDGETPKKAAENGFTYVFEGWSDEIGGNVISKPIAVKNTELYAVFGARAAERQKVDKPAADTAEFVYTGKDMQYSVTTDDRYKVYGSVQRDAGDHTVTVVLKDKTYTCWSDGTDADLKFEFKIEKAENAWTVEPNISDRHVGGSVEGPVGAAKFGDVVWSYSDIEDGEFVSAVPTEKGTYYARASVAENDNWSGLDMLLRFEILSDTFTVTFIGADGVVLGAREIKNQAQIVYDGETPEKAATAQFSYKFEGWSSVPDGNAETLTADGDMSVYAVFSQTVNSYTITFRDADGILDTVTAEYGAPVVYGGAQLGSNDGNIISVFAGWENLSHQMFTDELPAVTGDAVYFAVFESEFNPKLGLSADDPYAFTKASEMIFLAEYVNGGGAVNGMYFALGAYIDLTDAERAPIGTEEHPFDGVFDGCGKTLTLNGKYGIFGHNAGTVKNICVAADIDGGDIAGGIAAYNFGSVEYCAVNGKVFAATAAGGIVGINGGTVRSCKPDAVIKVGGKYAMENSVGGTNGGGVTVGKAADGHVIIYADEIWDGTAVATEFAGGDGSERAPYIIETAAQLAYFKDSIADSSYYKNKYIRLDNDIDLAGHTWSGIGGGSSTNGFMGVFDGNGHTVYNVSPVYGSRKGFFNSASGTIRDLTLTGTVSGTSAISYFGLLVGINGAAIENCKVYCAIDTAGTYVAAITGWSYGDITNCAAYGRVIGSNIVGGIVGYDIKQNNVIGNIVNCVNYAHISSDSAYAVANTSGIGGIAALVGSGAVIRDCVNHGDITGSNSVSDGGTGGIVGNNFISEITGCANFGTVKANSAVGGIIGYARDGGNIVSSKNYGEVIGTFAVAGISGMNRQSITESVNYGAVNGTGESYWIGGIAGMHGGGTTVENCENRGDIFGKGSSKGGVGGITGSSYDKTTVRRCNNYNFVTGNDGYCGGIVGENRSGATVTYCENIGGNELFGSDESSEELVYGNVNHGAETDKESA